MVKAVIFDMDGVIINSEPVHKKSELKLFNNLGLNISEEEHHSFTGTSDKTMWEALRVKYNLKGTTEELSENARNNFLKHLTSGKLEPMEGLPELIDEIKKMGFKTAVASSAAIHVIEIIIKTLRIKDKFDLLISGTEVPNGKPAPDVFLEAAKRLGVEPSQCIVIEDSDNGVKAAVSAGMYCVGLGGTVGQTLKEASETVNKLKDINLKKINESFQLT